MNSYFNSAVRLQRYLTERHERNGLVGPDPGVRFNYRIGRFIKSALPGWPWRDDLYYVQGQGYWVLANWALYDRTGDERQRRSALAASETMRACQRPDGAWDYPNPEWKGRIATTEGNWGALGLLETYRHTGDEATLDAILAWQAFLIERIGFMRRGDELAVSYFVGDRRRRVCNNSITTLRVLTEIASVTGDRAQLDHHGPGLVTFLQNHQTPSGEFPYFVAGEESAERPHFQCFQYNAFACLNLLRYYQLTGDEAMPAMLDKLFRFVSSGQAADGHAHYQCGNRRREIVYHTAALAAALATSAEMGWDEHAPSAERAYQYLLSRQRRDGGFPYSVCEYHLLRDGRSYPRYQAMILYHLLHAPGVQAHPSIEDGANASRTAQ